MIATPMPPPRGGIPVERSVGDPEADGCQRHHRAVLGIRATEAPQPVAAHDGERFGAELPFGACQRDRMRIGRTDTAIRRVAAARVIEIGSTHARQRGKAYRGSIVLLREIDRRFDADLGEQTAPALRSPGHDRGRRQRAERGFAT